MFTFMDNETYDQISLNKDIIGEDQVCFLQEGMEVTIESYEDSPIGVQLPELGRLDRNRSRRSHKRPDGSVFL